MILHLVVDMLLEDKDRLIYISRNTHNHDTAEGGKSHKLALTMIILHGDGNGYLQILFMEGLFQYRHRSKGVHLTTQSQLDDVIVAKEATFEMEDTSHPKLIR